MTDSPTQVQLMLRLLGKIQQELAPLSAENQLELLAALRDSINESRGSNNDHNSKNVRGGGGGPVRQSRRPKLQSQTRTGRKTNPGSVAHLATTAVLNSLVPLGAGEVLAVVEKNRPGVKPVNVYAALHAAAKNGQIEKAMEGRKAMYSRPTGGKKKK
ncbi:MAG TPA: hypothetical protein VGJ84_02185 [Polyangiaceae bacterium]|jgi:hypothetical protein